MDYGADNRDRFYEYEPMDEVEERVESQESKGSKEGVPSEIRSGGSQESDESDRRKIESLKAITELEVAMNALGDGRREIVN